MRFFFYNNFFKIFKKGKSFKKFFFENQTNKWFVGFIENLGTRKTFEPMTMSILVKPLYYIYH